MGGSLKGNSGGNRVKPYGFMLLLAFGAALLGVLVIHKLRERRIINLLIKEKDRDLVSLQFLMQKEREYTEEMKRENEELKANLISLRTQKMELDRRLVEMQSTISSLRDEGKTLESLLQEKQTEIKMLRETSADPVNEMGKIVALTESLKRKDAEIEDLKQLLENPAKIWSTRTDDSSNQNSTLTRDADSGETNEEGHPLIESTDNQNSANSTREDVGVNISTELQKSKNNRTENGSQKTMALLDEREISKEYRFQSLENSGEGFKIGGDKGTRVDDVQDNRLENAQPKVTFGSGGQNNSEPISKPQDSDGGLTMKDEKEESVSGGGKVEDNYQEEGHDQQGTFKGGVKLEMTDNSRKLGSRRKEKHLHVRANGKIWKILARNRWPESSKNYDNDEAGRIRSGKVSKDYQGGSIKRTEREEIITTSNNNQSEVKIPQDSSKSQLVERQDPQKHESVNGTPVKYVADDDANYPMDKVRTQETPQIFGSIEESTIKNLDGKVHNIRGNYKKQRTDEGPEHKDRDSGVPESKISAETENTENAAEQEGNPQATEVLDTEKQEPEAPAEEFYNETISTSEGSKVDYDEETDG